MRPFHLLFFLFFIVSAFGQNPEQPRPFSIGETFTLMSRALGEARTFNIYLPEGYHANDTTHYPVIYLLDGSADEDFIHVAGLVQFCNFPWVNLLPPSIVVGIANVDRRRDFTFPTTIKKDKQDFPTTGGSATFIGFIEFELQPYIERHYRTKGQRMLIGQSLGGLLATEVLFKKPQLFDQYLIISPSLWWDGESLLRQNMAARPGLEVHVSVGNEGKLMERDARKLVKQLRNAGIKTGYNYLGNEDHASIMHAALFDAFKWFAKN